MSDLFLSNYYRKPPWKIEIFDHVIYKYESPFYLYKNKNLKEDIDKLFDSDLIKEFGNYTPEQRGKSYSTCSFKEDELVFHIHGIFPLIEWIGCMILDKLKKSQKDAIAYKRIWLNKIFMGCSVICHSHEDSDIDGVAIFYINIPTDDSGQLIILKTHIEEEISEKHKSNCFSINVNSGDLIIHDADMPHAVSKHMNEEPIICLVIEFFDPSIKNNTE